MIDNLGGVVTQQQAITDETLPDRPKASEIAVWLRLHVNTIYQWAREGEIPCVRRGRTYLFEKQSLLEWAKPKTEEAA